MYIYDSGRRKRASIPLSPLLPTTLFSLISLVLSLLLVDRPNLSLPVKKLRSHLAITMHISFLMGATLALPVVVGRPMPLLVKRIAQTIADSTQPWLQACEAAGGGSQCNTISGTAFSTLLAAAGPCEQQDAADQMIDLAKSLNNDAKMVQLAQIFVQQPRNSPDSLSVLYCQQAPKNVELNELFQCQFDGVNPTTFTGNIQVGASGTIPLGLSSPVNPPRSCPANTQGGVTDGAQLVDITQDPGVGAPSSSSSSAASASSSAPASTGSATVTARAKNEDSDCEDGSSANAPVASSTAGNFQQQNKLDAQKLNAQFAALTANSSCTDGQSACVQGQFAQCVSGKFMLSSCGSLTCVALPLVNSPGTSVTCDTQADAEARIGGSLTGA